MADRPARGNYTSGKVRTTSRRRKRIGPRRTDSSINSGSKSLPRLAQLKTNHQLCVGLQFAWRKRNRASVLLGKPCLGRDRAQCCTANLQRFRFRIESALWSVHSLLVFSLDCATLPSGVKPIGVLREGVTSNNRQTRCALLDGDSVFLEPVAFPHSYLHLLLVDLSNVCANSFCGRFYVILPGFAARPARQTFNLGKHNSRFSKTLERVHYDVKKWRRPGASEE